MPRCGIRQACLGNTGNKGGRTRFSCYCPSGHGAGRPLFLGKSVYSTLGTLIFLNQQRVPGPVFLASLCVLTSSSSGGTPARFTGLVLTCHFCEDLVPKYSQVLRCWGREVGLQHGNLGAHNRNPPCLPQAHEALILGPSMSPHSRRTSWSCQENLLIRTGRGVWVCTRDQGIPEDQW